MAKKQKRQASRASSRKVTAEVSRETTSAPNPPIVTRSRISGGTEFNPDYSHQIGDLKRIGVLAGSFFALLIVLSFFLR